MSTADIRDKLIKKIQSTTDEKILLEANRLLEIQLNDIEISFKLTEEMNEAFDEARSQILNGEFQTHEEADKEISEWLEK